MSIKNREWILDLYPDAGGNAQPGSLDLELAADAIIFDQPFHYKVVFHFLRWWHRVYYPFAREKNGFRHRMMKLFKRFAHRERQISIRNGYWLKPGEMALLSSREEVVVPMDAAAMLTLKSSRGREGFNHALAGYFDIGFRGDAVFEVYAHCFPVYMYEGMPFAQLIYFDADTPLQGYDGHYQGQIGPTRSWLSGGN